MAQEGEYWTYQYPRKSHSFWKWTCCISDPARNSGACTWDQHIPSEQAHWTIPSGLRWWLQTDGYNTHAVEHLVWGAAYWWIQGNSCTLWTTTQGGPITCKTTCSKSAPTTSSHPEKPESCPEHLTEWWSCTKPDQPANTTQDCGIPQSILQSWKTSPQAWNGQKIRGTQYLLYLIKCIN